MTKYEFTSPSLNIAHTCGNVTAYVTDYLQTWFVPEFFKTVNVSSTMAYRYFNVLQNKNAEFFKKRKPYLIVQPRLEPDGAKFLVGTQLANRMTPTFDGGPQGNLQPFVEDKNLGYSLKFLMNRLAMSFDVSIIVETQMEQINLYNYIKNRQVWNMPLNWETALESHVPREMIAAISSMVDIPMTESGRMLAYLNGNSVYPVTYKIKNSTGNDEYFRYYPARIDAELTNLSIDSGNKVGVVDDAYGITFTVNTEFTTSGIYQILSQQPIPKYWEHGGEAIDIDKEVKSSDKGLHLDMLLTPYRDLGIHIPPGWKVYSNPSFKVTATAPDPDITDLSKLVSPALRQAINYHLTSNIPLDKLLTVFVMKDYKTLDPLKGEMSVDFQDMLLYTYLLNKTSTYRLLIIVNVEYFNELIVEQLNMEEK